MGIIIRQSIKGTIANYIGIAIGFVTTFFVLTKYLSTEEVGLTRALLDIAILFSGLAQLGTTASMMRFYPYFKDEEHKDHGVFFWSIVIPFIGFFIFLSVFLLCKDWIISKYIDNAPLLVNYYYFIIPLAFFMLYMSVFEINSNVLMRITIPKFIREVVIRASLLIGYLLFGFHYMSLDGLVIWFCATYGLATLLNIIYLLSLKRISFKPDWAHLTPRLKKDFALYTLFLITAALAGNITPTLSTLFVTAKMGLAYMGIYAIATYIATLVEIPYRSLGAITQPQIAQAMKDNDIDTADMFCKKVSLHQLLAGAFIFVMIWINIDLIFQILPNGNKYVEGKWVVFILACSRLFISTFSVGSSVLGYSRYYYMSLIFTAMLTTCAILLNIYLIPIFGMNGSALSNLISYVIFISLLLILIKWKIGTNPLSWAQLKVTLIIVSIFLLNIAWFHTLYPLFDRLPFNPKINAIIDGIVKTMILGSAGIAAIYFWKVSPEVNHIAQQVWNKIKKK
ncbi:MAG: oligosaccharide flippase family protein [Bacteroidales bacterium]|nr:oligosaccharide flippase family protein [Bacteroidales bacterium]